MSKVDREKISRIKKLARAASTGPRSRWEMGGGCLKHVEEKGFTSGWWISGGQDSGPGIAFIVAPEDKNGIAYERAIANTAYLAALDPDTVTRLCGLAMWAFLNGPDFLRDPVDAEMDDASPNEELLS